MSLEEDLKRLGPIPLSTYMEMCLAHPEYGYYQKKVPFGRRGDFVTAPEISQMFGELIAAWLIQVWFDQGQPTPFTLAELGPGRGTLMADIMRTARKVAPAFLDAAHVCLVETSPVLRALQKQTIDHPVEWVSEVDALPAAPLFFVANEFFDALPIRQYIYGGDEWSEQYVTHHEGCFQFNPCPCDPPTDTIPPAGGILEVCPLAPEIMGALMSRITPTGAGLIIDYGYTHDMRRDSGWRSTLQAIRAHAYADPLETPGEADLTAHVDFSVLATHAPNAKLASQRDFLQAMGIQARAEALFRANQDERVFADMHRLIAPEQMGRLFKVLAINPTQATAPEHY